MFYGLGADGTVGANKNTIKIIGEDPDFYAQGYFVYDSKKSGSQTVSHVRFGRNPIRSAYLIGAANFVGCHQFNFVEKIDLLSNVAPGATFLLNSPYGLDDTWDKLPRNVQQQMIEKKLKVHVIDAAKVARDTGMGTRINTIMQTCFFAISGVLAQRRGDHPDQGVDQENLRQEGRRDRPEELRGGGPHRSPTCTRSRSRTRSPAPSRCRRWCPPRRPNSCRRSRR